MSRQSEQGGPVFAGVGRMIFLLLSFVPVLGTKAGLFLYHGQQLHATCYALGCVLGVAIVDSLMSRSRSRGVRPLKLKEVKSIDAQAIGFIAVYAAPLLLQSF